ncbi:hypothetical protein [Methanosarcina siciliae]|uniref:hypothetical protein n=1 Tax=Methanosarcina siciliae TaxID=38027 RepID=UPI0011E5A26B|nr:hypothetical protein [Methanosarcina siciliae]
MSVSLLGRAIFTKNERRNEKEETKKKKRKRRNEKEETKKKKRKNSHDFFELRAQIMKVIKNTFMPKPKVSIIFFALAFYKNN